MKVWTKIVLAASLVATQVHAQTEPSAFVRPGFCYVQVASRETLPEVFDFTNDIKSLFVDLKVFESQNGWFPITVRLMREDYADGFIERYVDLGVFPDDAFCVSGKSFLREVKYQEYFSEGSRQANLAKGAVAPRRVRSLPGFALPHNNVSDANEVVSGPVAHEHEEWASGSNSGRIADRSEFNDLPELGLSNSSDDTQASLIEEGKGGISELMCSGYMNAMDTVLRMRSDGTPIQFALQIVDSASSVNFDLYSFYRDLIREAYRDPEGVKRAIDQGIVMDSCIRTVRGY